MCQLAMDGPRILGVVLAHLTNAEATLQSGVDHETSLTGWCRYASIAQFERTSLRRSPHLNIADDFIQEEIRRPIRVPEFTGFLKDTPSNREGLLYQFSVGHSRENGPSTDMFLYSTPGEPDAWRW